MTDGVIVWEQETPVGSTVLGVWKKIDINFHCEGAHPLLSRFELPRIKPYDLHRLDDLPHNDQRL